MAFERIGFAHISVDLESLRLWLISSDFGQFRGGRLRETFQDHLGTSSARLISVEPFPEKSWFARWPVKVAALSAADPPDLSRAIAADHLESPEHLCKFFVAVAARGRVGGEVVPRAGC